MAELAIGSDFAGHRIEGIAGRGGMGIVYRAVDLRLKRRVAMKVITPDLAQDAEFRERFERESQLAASIDHTNVLPIHGAGEDNGVLFITMRYVEGTDLAALLAREGRLQPERAVAIVYGVAGALDAAHGHGLIHRDVKPANILIEQHEGHEHVYLTDFGLTKVSGASGPTRTGFAVGTFDYMAPEQFLAQPVDPRSDVYALGCVLFETATGRVPFPRPGDAARMYAHIQESPPSPSEIAANLPQGFDEVVARALAKNPDDRYPSAGALAEAAYVAAGIAQPSVTPRPPSMSSPTLTTPPPGPPPSTTTPAPGADPDATILRPDARQEVAPPHTPAPPTAPPPPTGPADAKPRRPGPPIGVLIAAGAGVVVLIVLGVLLFGGGGDSVNTDTPEGTVSGFLQLVSEDDFSGACDLLTSTAQAQAVAAPGGDDCASGLVELSGTDSDAEATAVRDASFTTSVSGSSGTATVQMPDPTAAVTSAIQTVTLGLEQSESEWLISDIEDLCFVRGTTC